jgi:hypothetical protein
VKKLDEKSVLNKKEQFIAVAFERVYESSGYDDHSYQVTKTSVFPFDSQKELESFILENTFKPKYVKILTYIARGVDYSTFVSLNLGDKDG